MKKACILLIGFFFVQFCRAQDTLFTVKKISYVGNKLTVHRIIERELSVRENDTVSYKRLQYALVKDKQKIYNLRLFNTVSVTYQKITDTDIEIQVAVTERWYTFPVPLFALSDRNFNEWWYNYGHSFRRVNFGLKLYQFNFRGRNETLRFTAQFGFTRQFNFAYRIPYIDKKQKQGLSFEYTYSEPKNVPYQTADSKIVFAKSNQALTTSHAASASYFYRKNFYETHALSTSYTTTSVADTVVSKLNDNFFGDGQTKLNYGMITYSFTHEHRDVIQYPLHGIMWQASLNHVASLSGTRQTQWELEASAAIHREPLQNLFFSTFTSFYLSAPNRVPYVWFGGLGSSQKNLRGYELYFVEGPQFLMNKSTLKYRLLKREWRWKKFPMEQFRHFPIAIYVKTYTDWGYVKNYAYYKEKEMNTRLTNTLLGSAGAGLDVVLLYDLVLRFEYSWNRFNERGFVFNLRKEF